MHKAMLVLDTLLFSLLYLAYRLRHARRANYFKQSARDITEDKNIVTPIAAGMAKLSLVDKWKTKEEWREKIQSIIQDGYKIVADEQIIQSGQYSEINEDKKIIHIFKDAHEKMALPNAVRYTLREFKI